MLDDEPVLMAEDLIDLPEADYNDPLIQQMIKEDEESSLKRFGKITSEELEELYRRADKLQEESRGLKRREAVDVAWSRMKSEKLAKSKV